MNTYEIILWDVDDTLLDFGRSEESALSRCFDKYGLTLTQEMKHRYAQINLSYWKRLELGEVDKATVLHSRFSDLFEEYGIAGIDVEAFRNDYQFWLGSVYYYLEDSKRLLQELKQEGYRQYVVTNGVAWTQRNKLQLAGMDLFVEELFISEELGAPKPDLTFFEACFARIPDFDKGKTILIGDSLTSDMKGAVNAGISSCWYNPKKKENTSGLIPDYEIDSIWKIKEIIKKRG